MWTCWRWLWGSDARPFSDSGSLVVVAIEPTQTLGHGFSFGANLWMQRWEEVSGPIEELKMTTLRLWDLAGHGDYPTSEGFDSVYDHMQSRFDNPYKEKIRKFAEQARAHGVDIMLNGNIPKNCTRRRTLLRKHVQDAAYVSVALVLFLKQECGLTASSIELSNEPEGTWTCRIDPEVYAELACTARQLFDAKGLQDVLIAGPGTSVDCVPRGAKYPLKINDNNDWKYWSAILAVEAKAKMQCVGIASTHIWEAKFSVFASTPAEMDRYLIDYMRDVRPRFDPDGKRPLYATECGARRITINGHKFKQHVNGAGAYINMDGKNKLPDDAQLNSPLYATLVARHTLYQMNHGFHVAVFWRLIDYTWDSGTFGLLTPDGEETAPMKMKRALFAGQFSPNQAGMKVVQRTWYDTDTVQAAAASDRKVILWVAHMPRDGSKLERHYRVAGATGLASSPDVPFKCYPENLSEESCSATWDGGVVIVKLDADAVIAVSITLLQ